MQERSSAYGGQKESRFVAKSGRVRMKRVGARDGWKQNKNSKTDIFNLDVSHVINFALLTLPMKSALFNRPCKSPAILSIMMSWRSSLRETTETRFLWLIH